MNLLASHANQIRVGEKVAGDQPTVVVRTQAEQLTGYEAELGTVTVSEKAPASGEFVAPGVGREYPFGIIYVPSSPVVPRAAWSLARIACVDGPGSLDNPSTAVGRGCAGGRSRVTATD